MDDDMYHSQHGWFVHPGEFSHYGCAAADDLERLLAPDYGDNVTGNAVICDTLRERIVACRDRVHELAEACRELASGEFHQRDLWLTFWNGDRRLREAFNDGAGAEVLP